MDEQFSVISLLSLFCKWLCCFYFMLP